MWICTLLLKGLNFLIFFPFFIKMAETIVTDVFICGAGPVGLLLAYQLSRAGISSVIIDRYDAEKQATFGRATTLFPRTLEMLDQLDLLDEMNQIGVPARNSITYNSGKRVTDRGFHFMFDAIANSFHDYILNIRQKFSEDIFRNGYRKNKGNLMTGWTLKDFELSQSSEDGYKVTSTIVSAEQTKIIKSKYIIGADGGNSTVRELANIEFQADKTAYRWIRLDGIFKTNMPDNEIGFAAIESKTHGQVLWVQLDHGVQRIGFSLNKGLIEKYGDTMTIDDVIAEAKKAIAPFELEVVRVEWWTNYKIRQGVAKQFVKGPVILAGDACHVHSSGAAQGMNTGVHDSINLGWKLVGVLKGWFGENVLNTYDTERRPAAETLIRLDKGFSTTISGEIPDEYKGLYTDPMEVWALLFDRTIQFTVGLGISFGSNVLNCQPNTGSISAGRRAPDCLLHVPGPRQPIRLFQLTKNTAQFFVLVFTGIPSVTSTKKLRLYVDSDDSFTKILPKDSFQFLTILAGISMQADVALGVEKFGRAYFDVDNSAHAKYGLSVNKGAIVVVRPDGILGFATNLDNPEEMGNYFRHIFKT